jgi:hypothetical protein
VCSVFDGAKETSSDVKITFITARVRSLSHVVYCAFGHFIHAVIMVEFILISKKVA